MNEIKMYNPSNGDYLGDIEESNELAVKSKIERAKNAFKIWSKITLDERLEYLKRMRKYIAENGQNIAEKISEATGKPKIEAYISEVVPVLDAIAYYEKHAPEFLETKKVKTPLFLKGRKSYIQYRPMGIVAVISPWNYPFQLAVIPAISAIISGNAVVLKPSVKTAYVGVVIENIVNDIGMPEGVFQVLHGDYKVGEALVNAKPDKIFFTGSVQAGKKIMAKAAENLIPVELELGGKDPMIVFEDANLERAVNGAVWGAFTNSGQTCVSVERVYVHESIYTEFIHEVSEKVEKLKQGYGDGFDIGGMTVAEQTDIVSGQIKDALDKGAVLLCGGKVTEDKRFIEPTVLIDVNHGMTVMREETFGPVMPIMSFRTEEEAIELANDSEFGLGASVWSSDLDKADRVASKIESGHICINDVISAVANINLPFGGMKNSGIGRYHGQEGLYTFCHQVSIFEDKGKKSSEPNWYPYSWLKLKPIMKILEFLYK